MKCFVAEGEGFEPPEALTSMVFKTTAIGRSAILPQEQRRYFQRQEPVNRQYDPAKESHNPSDGTSDGGPASPVRRRDEVLSSCNK